MKKLYYEHILSFCHNAFKARLKSDSQCIVCWPRNQYPLLSYSKSGKHLEQLYKVSMDKRILVDKVENIVAKGKQCL